MIYGKIGQSKGR